MDNIVKAYFDNCPTTKVEQFISKMRDVDISLLAYSINYPDFFVGAHWTVATLMLASNQIIYNYKNHVSFVYDFAKKEISETKGWVKDSIEFIDCYRINDVKFNDHCKEYCFNLTCSVFPQLKWLKDLASLLGGEMSFTLEEKGGVFSVYGDKLASEKYRFIYNSNNPKEDRMELFKSMKQVQTYLKGFLTLHIPYLKSFANVIESLNSSNEDKLYDQISLILYKASTVLPEQEIMRVNRLYQFDKDDFI